MAWDQLWVSDTSEASYGVWLNTGVAKANISFKIDKPHLAYAVIGGFVTVFSLISLFVKEKLYIGEATVATIFGLIVGPHCLNWFSPTTWGNSDFITIEVSRIVLVVQIFAVAVELPKKYMLKHWLSVLMLLLPVMTFGWLISSVFIWKLVPTLSWIQGLAIAACVTATDPVLASAVVGKGKFARRVPGHLRNILSAESGSNDGMAFPFAYLALSIILHKGHPNTIAFNFIVLTVLYECIFGCILGAVIGYTGRHLIKFAENKNLIDRESFLVFYFVLALLCTGVGSIIGVDDLLVSFAAGTAFSWDGWFAKKTEESHVSNVIDLLLNMAYFVYLGAIIPWQDFNNASLGIEAWKLVILAILILLFRRIPIVLALKPVIPDIRNWREALFCGHFGPIGVGAIFISILVRAELEHGEPTPLAELPPPGSPNYYAIATIWPIVTFLVISSIIVHGSSIAVFTLGKRLNNMTITMTYTTGGNNQSWLSRLPRIEGARTVSLHTVDTDEPIPKKHKIGTTAKPAGGMRRRKKGEMVKPGGRREPPENIPIDLSAGGAGKHISDTTPESQEDISLEEKSRTDDEGINAYEEGKEVIIEDHQGEIIAMIHEKKSSTESEEGTSTSAESSTTHTDRLHHTQSGSPTEEEGEPVEDSGIEQNANQLQAKAQTRAESTERSPSPHTALPHDHRQHYHSQDEGDEDEEEEGSANGAEDSGHHYRRRHHRGGQRVFAYQLDDDVIVENEDGDIIRRYKINRKPTIPEHVQEHTQQAGPSHISADDSQVRGRSDSLIGRTLSKVGLARLAHSFSVAENNSTSPRATPPFATSHSPNVDVEKNQQDDIVPVGGGEHEHHRFPFDDETIRKHLKSLLNTGDLKPVSHEDKGNISESKQRHHDSNIDSGEQSYRHFPHPQKPTNEGEGESSGFTKANTTAGATTQSINTASLPRNFLGRLPKEHDDEDDDAEDDDEGEQERHERAHPQSSHDEEETAVERKRRLAALGLLNTHGGDEDDDDEEEPSKPVSNRSRRLGRSPPPSAIREEDDDNSTDDDDEEEEHTQRIKWRHDVKRGGSGL